MCFRGILFYMYLFYLYKSDNNQQLKNKTIDLFYRGIQDGLSTLSLISICLLLN